MASSCILSVPLLAKVFPNQRGNVMDMRLLSFIQNQMFASVNILVNTFNMYIIYIYIYIMYI